MQFSVSVWLTFGRYRRSLRQVAALLPEQDPAQGAALRAKHPDWHTWSWRAVVRQWIVEADRIRLWQPGSLEPLTTHVNRTRTSFGGMGSLNDVSASSMTANGKLNKAIQRLLDDTNALLGEIEQLLARSAR